MFDAIKAAQGAGFEDDALVEIVAISGLESGWSEKATADTRQYSEKRGDGRWYIPGTDQALPAGVGPEYSVGPLQINLNYWTDIAEWQARWWPAAFAWAHALWTADGDFNAWRASRLVTEAERNVVRHALSQPHPQPVSTSGPEGATTLDAGGSTRLVQALWQLIGAGAHLTVDPIEGTDMIAVAVDVKRGDLLGVVPELADVLP